MFPLEKLASLEKCQQISETSQEMSTVSTGLGIASKVGLSIVLAVCFL